MNFHSHEANADPFKSSHNDVINSHFYFTRSSVQDVTGEKNRGKQSTGLAQNLTRRKCIHQSVGTAPSSQLSSRMRTERQCERGGFHRTGPRPDRALVEVATSQQKREGREGSLPACISCEEKSSRATVTVAEESKAKSEQSRARGT